MRSHLRTSLHVRSSLQRTKLSLLVFCILFSISSTVEVNAASVDKSPQSISQRTTSSEETGLLTVVGLADVPPIILRRATDFLDELRSSETAPGWTIARFSDDPRVLYRPDVEGPAYYEFPIEAQNADGAFMPVGFVQLATGSHDFPISHWNIEGLSPTQDLDSLAADSGGQNNAYYKLNVLSYASEYDGPAPISGSPATAGILTLGDLPAKIDGLQALPLNSEFELSSVEYPVLLDNIDDSEVITDVTIAPISSPETVGPLNDDLVDDLEWGSWNELKAGYQESYGTMLAFLGDEAAPLWNTEQSPEQAGEALIQGDVRVIRALQGRTLEKIEVIGEQSVDTLLQVEELPAGELNDGVRLTVLDVPAAPLSSRSFTVTLTYANSPAEELAFSIVNQERPSAIVYLPLINASATDERTAAASSSKEVVIPAKSSEVVTVASADSSSAIQSTWSPWRYWLAGSHADQRQYRQVGRGEAPNNSTCSSGSGATAWAMLFGWADYKASLNDARWRLRDGLYRENGGRGSNSIIAAPATTTTGVKNMIWEIRNQINTNCVNSTGIAAPSEMHNAAQYLQGRTGATLTTHFNWARIQESRLRDRAINSIKNGTPVVIGTGSNQYALAYQYVQRSRRVWLFTQYERWFYVNRGTGSASTNGFVPAATWFVGQLHPQTVRENPVDDDFSLLTHNVWLKPGPLGKDVTTRRIRISEASYIRNHDVVVLNELYADDEVALLQNALRSEYPDQTIAIGRFTWTRFWDETVGTIENGVFQTHGGVAVYSKWPIEERIQFIYPLDDLCGADRLSNKGFAYVRIRYKDGQNIHLIATHTQSADRGLRNLLKGTWLTRIPCRNRAAGFEDGAPERKREFQHIRKFLRDKGIPRDELVFIAGDLNVIKGTPEYTDMLNTLNAADVSTTGHYASYDPKNNRYIDEGPRSEILDYVLVSKDFRQPSEWFNHILKPSADYADHYPVSGSVQSKGSPTSPPAYYEIEFKTADQRLAGTDNRVYVTLIGSTGRTPEFYVNEHISGDDSGDAFERDQTDWINFEAHNIGTLQSIQIRKARSNDWRVEAITINSDNGNQVASWSGDCDIDGTYLFTLNSPGSTCTEID